MSTLLLLLADFVVLIHLGFVAFVLLGALLALKWRKLAFLHLPALAWGIYIEWTRTICPLTPLEIWLRHQAGADAYSGGFISHYLVPILYPPGLTAAHQQFIAAGLLLGNALIYGYLLYRRRKAGRL